MVKVNAPAILHSLLFNLFFLDNALVISDMPGQNIFEAGDTSMLAEITMSEA